MWEVVGGHVRRGGGCFTVDSCELQMDLGGSLARGFALLIERCIFSGRFLPSFVVKRKYVFGFCAKSIVKDAVFFYI